MTDEYRMPLLSPLGLLVLDKSQSGRSGTRTDTDQNRPSEFMRRVADNQGPDLMNLPTFVIAVFTLLILPGPTNAVLALASTALTVWRSLSLIASVVLAYLAIIVPVSGIAAPLLNGHPGIACIVKLASAIWVLYLALKLWVPAPAGRQNALGIGQLFVTTLLNPKAIIIGLTLVPAVQAGVPAAMVAFVCCATVTSATWLGIGGLLVGRHAQMPPFARHCGCAVLVAFSLTLAVSALWT
jgi:threonine/homoserine/homoserine lactone efflux protein